MPGRRPRLIAAGAVACLLALTGCSDAVEVDSPELSGDEALSCSALVGGLPDTVGDQERREVDPADAYAAAYGDPALVVTCGVPEPEGLRPTSECVNVNGVDWFLPEGEGDLVATTIGREPSVELRVPRSLLPPDAELVDVAQAVREHTEEVRPCL
jgi:hypothetical protein